MVDRRRILLTAVTTAVASFVPTAVGQASVVRANVSGLTVLASPGETNTVWIRADLDYVYITDSSAPITVDGVCRLADAHTAVCSASSSVGESYFGEEAGAPMTVDLGDRNDRVRLGALFARTTVHGGTGNDVITVDRAPRRFGLVYRPGPFAYLFGDAGNDTLVGSGLGDTLAGGDGSDSINGREGADTISTEGTIASRAVDQVRCGTDDDTVDALTNDKAAPDCEVVEHPGSATRLGRAVTLDRRDVVASTDGRIRFAARRATLTGPPLLTGRLRLVDASGRVSSTVASLSLAPGGVQKVAVRLDAHTRARLKRIGSVTLTAERALVGRPSAQRLRINGEVRIARSPRRASPDRR